MTVVSKQLSAVDKRAGCMQVQKPSRQQHKDSKMGPGKVFVVYFGTNEISALPKNRIKSWNTHPAPRSAVGDLKAAILEARQAVRKI
jgi:hypothetical protein